MFEIISAKINDSSDATVNDVVQAIRLLHKPQKEQNVISFMALAYTNGLIDGFSLDNHESE